MQTFIWAIEDIESAHPGLFLNHHAVMAVALMSRLSSSPCEFLVECEGFNPPGLEGETRFLVRVSWQEDTELAAERVRHTEQTRSIVERAAVALATLLFARLIPDGRLRVTNEAERADFWLPRLRCALEISGTEHHREVARRHREKTAQMLANPRRWNGYAFVCCFSANARLIRWSYHTQEEREYARS
jgi:hypothetical protein